MLNKLFPLILLLFSISLAQAELNVISGTNVSLKTNTPQNFSLVLQNTYPFSIFDLDFTNTNGFKFENITIQPNETRTLNFEVNRASPGSFNINSLLSFKYMVDIPQGFNTYEVNITPSGGLQPQSITIRKGDTILWNNLDSINREISSGYFDMIISPNTSNSFTFGNTGDISYQDMTLFYAGQVKVINETELTPVNNPSYNKQVFFSLDVTTSPTNLEITNSEYSFNVNATSTQDGLLTLKNIGSETANSIQLISVPSWVSFEQNNLNLAPGQTKYIVYHVSPAIYKIDDTNKSYDIALIISGINFNTTTIKVNVSVPYDGTLGTLESNEGFLAFYKRFCEQNPSLVICNNTISAGNDSLSRVTDPVLQVNLTATQLMEALRRIQSLADSQARTDTKINDLAVTLNDALPTSIQLSNSSLQKQFENEYNQNANQWTFWLSIIFGGLIIATIIIFMIIKKHKDNVNLYSGGYDYKYK